MWEYVGNMRPDFAEAPGPGQESVWDYPRPPALVASDRSVEVQAGGKPLAATSAALRVLETASPPTWYIPPDDVVLTRLVPADHHSWCEWKGDASYWALADDPAVPVAWSYANPRPRFAKLRNYFGFYPARVDCRVDGEPVRAQPGGFYGGWITDDVVGPFKGAAGSNHW